MESAMSIAQAIHQANFRGKNKNQTVTAVGRELLGFIWDIAVKTERKYQEKQAA